MQTNLEQAKQAVLHLPNEEFEKFDEWYETERHKKLKDEEKHERLKNQLERFKQSEKWLKKNRVEYLGQWVCLYGDRLIAHGADGRKVFQQAKEAGIESPYLVSVIEEPEAFCGAWL